MIDRRLLLIPGISLFFIISVLGCASMDTSTDLDRSTTTTPMSSASTPATTLPVENKTVVSEQAAQVSTAGPDIIESARPGFAADAPQESAECRAMTKELETLRGKPLRRSALEERYQMECKR